MIMETHPELNINGEPKKLTPQNIGVALFREMPEFDYLDYYEPEGEGYEHTMVFNRREFLIWMGNVALNSDDERTLNLANRQHGAYRDRFGWNPCVIIEDYPSADERELYVEFQSQQLNDLKQLEGFIKDE